MEGKLSVEEAIIALLGANNSESMSAMKIHTCLFWLSKSGTIEKIKFEMHPYPFSQKVKEALGNLEKQGIVRMV